MWADTLYALERGHLLRLLVWGASSVLSATLLITWLVWKRETAPMLRHFAIQSALAGGVIVLVAAWGWHGLEMRDFAGLQRLLNLLWFDAGLSSGYAALGATLAMLGWRGFSRPSITGAGLGITVQGIALLLFQLRIIAAIGPVR